MGSEQSPKPRHLDEDIPALLADLNDPNPLVSLLRAHLYIEAELVALIEGQLRVSDALKVDELRFVTKVQLAVALGAWEREYADACMALNRVRNRVAHRLDHRLSEVDETELIAAMPDDAIAFTARNARILGRGARPRVRGAPRDRAVGF